MIAALVARGEELRYRVLSTSAELVRAQSDQGIWLKFGRETLLRIFSENHDANLFDTWMGAPYTMQRFDAEVEAFKAEVQRHIDVLSALELRLPLIPEGHAETSPARPIGRSDPKNGKVFLVHGHDTALLTSVDNFVMKLGLSTIVLHEQPNKGSTVIEKFERYSDVSYAIVLLTADDIGASKLTPEQRRPRARQNALFELGYFRAALCQERVCVIADRGIELPSDLGGLVTVASDDWKSDLRRELKDAGFTLKE